jgi:uncharacterized protein with HEPN domain
MKKDPRIFVHHILESICLIEGYSDGKTLEDFIASTSLQDMIIRRIEIIGEAVKNLPDDLRDEHPEVPWRKMAGIGISSFTNTLRRPRIYLGWS